MELTLKDLTLKQIAELFLKEIFSDYQNNKGTSFTNMENVAQKVGLKVYDDRIIQATSLLKTAGYIEAMPMAGGISLVKLTAKGILHLEETADFQIKNVGNISGQTIINYFDGVNKSQINVNSPHSVQNINKGELDRMLTSLEKIISENEQFRKDERKDYLADIKILREELGKMNPDKSFLKSKLENLAKLAPIATLVNTVIALLAL